jgi:hypothetical protein
MNLIIKDNEQNKYQAEAVLKELTEHYETGNLFEYTEDVLDVNYLVNSDKTFKAVKLLVAFGGPNIWIDTETGFIEVYWGNDIAKRAIPSNIQEAINELFEENYNSF